MAVRVIRSRLLLPSKKRTGKGYSNNTNPYHMKPASKYLVSPMQLSSGLLDELSDLPDSIEPGGSEGVYLYYNSQEQDVEGIVAGSLGDMEEIVVEDAEEDPDDNYTLLLEQIAISGSPKLEIPEDAEVKELASVQLTPEELFSNDVLAPLNGVNAYELFACMPFQELVEQGIITGAKEGLCVLLQYLN